MEKKEAMKILKDFHDKSALFSVRTALDTIIPELRESEDEKIRKAIIELVKQSSEILSKQNQNNMLTWLEKQGEPQDKGEISDGYHTFNELYYYRMLYNAAFFNMLPKEWVHKSKKHHDGEDCFGGGWFIVMANLPTGQISNHYELKDWDLFQIPEKEVADKWDGHTPQEAADRLHKYLLEKQDKQPSAIRWYDVSLIPQEMEELLVEWDSEDATWHEIAFYHADTKTFWNGTRQVENVTRWCYITDLLEKQGEEKTANYPIEGMYPYTDPADTLDGEIENIWNKLRNCDNTFTAAKSGFYEVIHHFATWLEKQGYTKKDVDDAYLKGICNTKHELEKQGEQKSQRMVSAKVKEALYDKPTDEEMKELLRTEYEKGRADTIAEMYVPTQISPEESLGVSSEKYMDIVDTLMQGGQKPAKWSLEDERVIAIINNALTESNTPPDDYDKVYDWLESLRQKIGG